METLEDNKIYRLDHNGIISVAYVEDRPLIEDIAVFDTNRAWSLAGYVSEETENGIRFVKGESFFEFSPLTLDTATEIFPRTIRKFKDLAVLESFARREIEMAESYEVNTAPEETISFTVSDEDEVLALIKVTDSGDMFYFADDWVEVTGDEELPTIYDQQVIDVEREDIGAALELWKESVANGTTLTKEDILTLAALDQ
jgi:hypothetical protein